MKRWISVIGGVIVLFTNALVYGLNTDWIGAQDSDFNNAANWDNGVPGINDIGILNSSAPLTLSVVTRNINPSTTYIGGLTFNNGASPYTIAVSGSGDLSFFGPGIVNNSGNTQTLQSSGTIQQSQSQIEFFNTASASNVEFQTYDNSGATFHDSTTASSATFINHGAFITFTDTSTAGHATITNLPGSVVSPNSQFYGNTLFMGNSSAGNATINNDANITITGFQDQSSAGTAVINNNGGSLSFAGSATASSATITNAISSSLNFYGGTGGNATITNFGFAQLLFTSTAGSAHISNANGTIIFDNTATAGDSTINQSSGSVLFRGNSTAGNAIVTISDQDINNDAIQFSSFSSAGNSVIANGGGIVGLFQAATASSSAITNYSGGVTEISGDSSIVTATAGQATIVNTSSGALSAAGSTIFSENSTAAGAIIMNTSGTYNTSGFTNFNSNSDAGNAKITNNTGVTNFYDVTTASSAFITDINNGSVNFSTAASAGNATIVNSTGSANFFNVSNAGNAQITNTNSSSVIQFNDASNAGNATLTNSSAGLIQFNNFSGGGNASVVNNGGTFTISNVNSGSFTVGSIAGNGSFLLGSETLTTGGNGTDTSVSGMISGTGGSLVKVGTGTLTLSGSNTYTGGTTVAGGTLNIINDANLGNTAGGLTLSNNSTLQTGAGITSNRGITLTSGGGTVDTNGFNSSLLGNIQGSGALVKAGNGALTLAGSNSYAGGTLINGGVLQAGGTNVLPASGSVVLANTSGAQLDLNGYNQTIGSLSGGGSQGGDVTLGTATLTVGGDGTSGTYGGSISGSGSIVKMGDGSLTLSGTNVFTGSTTVDSGSLNLTGSLRGDAVIEPSANFSNVGTMGGILNMGTLTPGINGVGTLTVSDYSGPGMLHIIFNQSSHNDLQVTGNATLTGGALAITGIDFTSGQYSVMTASAIVGSFATVILPTPSFFLTVSTAYTPTDVDINIHAMSFADAAQTGNQGGVATVLDAGKVGATGAFATAVQAIFALPTADQVHQAFNQICGDSIASFQQSGMHSAQAFTNQMNERSTPAGFADAGSLAAPVQLAYSGDLIGSALGLGGSSPTSPKPSSPNQTDAPSYGLWSRGLGFFDNVNGNSSIGSPGSRDTTGGFQAGYDFVVAEDVIFGLSGGFAQTSVSVDDRSSSGNSTSIQSGIYASYTPGPWFLNGSMAYTTSSNAMARPIVFTGANEQASSNFQSRVYTSFLEGGYRYQPYTSFTVEPSLSLRDSRMTQDGFTESGALGLDLTVNEQTTNSLVSDIGTRITKRFMPKSAHSFVVGARAGWEHELANVDNSVTAQFADAASAGNFTVQGTPRSRDAAALGLDIHIPLARNLQGFADYSATISSEQNTQGIFGGLSVKW